MPLIFIAPDARKGKPPCGECHIKAGETCDICGATAVFVHATPKCDHEFAGWRDFADGRGGEQVCTKCGMGAMADSLRNGP